MTALSLLNLMVAALELCVPSYALRLVRRFGARQVGAFIIIAFASLALLHLVNPLKATSNPNLVLSVVYAGASVLLLIGMGHTETVCRQRQQAQLDEQRLRAKMDVEVRERAENLLQLKQEMAQEIVRLQQQVETLGASERQFRFLFVQHPQPMWMFDLRSGRILAGNQAALKQYGFTHQEFTALSAKDLLSREAGQAFVADAAKPCSGLEERGIWRHRRKDRSTVDVDVLALDLRFGDCPARLILAQDIGPRASREAAMCDQERMRVLHQVAEGIAHHFGHILAVVEGQTNLLRGDTAGAEENEHVEQVLTETRRGNALIRQMMAVAACEAIHPEPTDINAFISKQEILLRRLIRDGISLEFHFGEGLMPALADTRILECILVNLVLNARDALSPGGSIDIHTEPAWIEGQSSHPVPNTVCGHYVHLTVRDNGRGMPPEIQEHVFQPFFTTRKDGSAMGLGLATIYGAVKQHGGWVEFASHPHRGTEFSVFLPVAQPVMQANPVALRAPTRETILLVEANDQVRDLTRHILQRNGYRVIEADIPATAMLLMEAQANQVQLLLTNLNFPSGATGCDLADQLHQIKADVEVVYATAPLSAEDNKPDLQSAKLLLKPYTPDQLLQTIAQALRSQAPQND